MLKIKLQISKTTNFEVLLTKNKAQSWTNYPIEQAGEITVERQIWWWDFKYFFRHFYSPLWIGFYQHFNISKMFFIVPNALKKKKLLGSSIASLKF